jgi:hypothetical protein
MFQFPLHMHGDVKDPGPNAVSVSALFPGMARQSPIISIYLYLYPSELCAEIPFACRTPLPRYIV